MDLSKDQHTRRSRRAQRASLLPSAEEARRSIEHSVEEAAAHDFDETKTLDLEDGVLPDAAHGSDPSDLGAWEAACMKNVADLLDSLQEARVRWEQLSSQHAAANERADRATERATRAEDALRKRNEELGGVRKRLEEVEQSRNGLRTAQTQAEETAAQRERELAAARTQADALRTRAEELAARTQSLVAEAAENGDAAAALGAARGRVAKLEEQAAIHDEERAGLTERVRDLEGRLREAAGPTPGLKIAQEELAKAHGQVTSLGAELREARRQLAERTEEIDHLQRASKGGAKNIEAAQARVTTLTREIEELREENERSLLAICDFRVRDNRRETELDEARDKARRKVKKILAKVHAELDAVGAPSGEDISFGERIRMLSERIAELEERLRDS